MNKNEIQFVKVCIPIKEYISIVKPDFNTKMLGTSCFNLLTNPLKVMDNDGGYFSLIGYNNKELLLERKDKDKCILFNDDMDIYLIGVEAALKVSLKNLNYYEQLNLFNNGETNSK